MEMEQKSRLLLLLLILHSWSSLISAATHEGEALALYTLSSFWENKPRNWMGSDPCGSNWIGLNCSNSHITLITLPGMNISGTLSEDIQNLHELTHLDLSFNEGLGGELPRTIGNLVKLTRLLLIGCSFSGSIPPELGQLPRLKYLVLNSNKLNGSIPGELGNLTELFWFDITCNQLSGSIPVSTDTNIGLDNLTKVQHLHFGNNKLSGPIPAKLFHSNMSIRHVLFDSNELTGSIPSTVGLLGKLEALRLDRNSLTEPVPSSLNSLTQLSELDLSNNQLSGPLPNLNGMHALASVDMSNNSFDQSDVPTWFSNLPLLTTLVLEYLQVAGEIPASLFSIPTLQKVRLRNNRFNETLDLGSQFSRQLVLVDVQENRIQELFYGGYQHDLRLHGNPYCNQVGLDAKYCSVQVQQQSTPESYSIPMQDCSNVEQCPSDQQMSPICNCSYPYEGTIVFRYITFSDIQNISIYHRMEEALNTSFQGIQVSVSSLSLKNPHIDNSSYFLIDLWMFPHGKPRFDQAEILQLSQLFSNMSFESPPDGYGPYYFIAVQYPFLDEAGSTSKKWPLIVGATIGALAFAAFSIVLALYALKRRRKLKKDKRSVQISGSWNPSRSGSGVPQLKGSRLFTFEELRKCTNDFSDANVIGSGSFGKVYRGALDDGQLVAVKRAQEGSMQGGREFKTEIEMLSRVHHRNLVILVGFCFDQNEQMLVYEFVPNGSLRESLSGKSGVHLDWERRLKIALGAARGLTYLHELASPRIIHRDIKSNNILLDHRLNAKVSDFGLCKPLADDKRGYISTQVKGTLGYLDPEYYMTQHLTEKSDVYSFGVLLLEMITGQKPLERGRFVVREVRTAMDGKKDLRGLQELLDPAICMSGSLPGLKRYVDLAMRCVEESSGRRPWMSEAAKEIENIMVLAGMNPYIASETNSASFGGSTETATTTRSHPYNNDASFDYSGGSSVTRVEPK